MKYSIWNYVPAKPEVNGGPSMVVPGRSMTIKEILARFTSGMLSPEDLNHSTFDYSTDDKDLEVDTDPRFDDPVDDLLYDGSTDMAEVLAAKENSLAAARSLRRSVSEPKGTDQPPTNQEERSDDAGGEG